MSVLAAAAAVVVTMVVAVVAVVTTWVGVDKDEIEVVMVVAVEDEVEDGVDEPWVEARGVDDEEEEEAEEEEEVLEEVVVVVVDEPWEVARRRGVAVVSMKSRSGLLALCVDVSMRGATEDDEEGGGSCQRQTGTRGRRNPSSSSGWRDAPRTPHTRHARST